jgi:hypothetical protein
MVAGAARFSVGRYLLAVLATRGAAQLLRVAREIYDLSQGNHDFLNAGCVASENRPEPYKKVVDDAIYPNVCQRMVPRAGLFGPGNLRMRSDP